jgi:glycine dehydrogenase subunit 2
LSEFTPNENRDLDPGAHRLEPTLFSLSKAGRRGYRIPASDVPELDSGSILGEDLARKAPPPIPSLSEPQVARHFTRLSQLNFCIDTGFYPLGSCTMKYNPKINEDAARHPGMAHLHPMQSDADSQGALEVMHRLETMLCQFAGMQAFNLTSLAGAQGEFVGLLLIRAYLDSIGETGRDTILVPDSAHGTNPASAILAGFRTVQIPSNNRGRVDVDKLKAALNERTAGLMMTNPNTLGLFETDILEIAELVHEAGGQLYYDGANLNAIAGVARPGDMGFDVVHINLHKTFSTPHGGGGPGGGPVGVKSHLIPFLPVPRVAVENGEQDPKYRLDFDQPESIGAVSAFWGNFGILLRAYVYLRNHGAEGIKRNSQLSVLNANYLKALLQEDFPPAYPGICMHEFVLNLKKANLGEQRAMGVAKRLLDHGVHAPTVYFPLVVPEAAMIEPPESETPETLDRFARIMKKVQEECLDRPDLIEGAPWETPVRALDEVYAARNPVLIETLDKQPEVSLTP